MQLVVWCFPLEKWDTQIHLPPQSLQLQEQVFTPPGSKPWPTGYHLHHARDRPEREQEGETCFPGCPMRDSPRFHALAVLVPKSYSNSCRELSRWDSLQIDPPGSNTHRQLSRKDSPWVDPPRRFLQSQGLQDYRVCSCRAGSGAKTSRQSLLEPRTWKSRYNLGSAPMSTAGNLEAWRSPARARALQPHWFPAAQL